MGIIRNLKDGEKKQPKNRVKKFFVKKARNIGIIVLLVMVLLLSILGLFDLGIELFTAENNPQLIYDTFEIEDVAELIVIKENGSGGYYLDFVDDIDKKLEEIINKMNKGGEYHNVPNDVNFLKKMLKAEVVTQFPDLGGEIPSGSTDGFQGAVQIRRVTPNKDPGVMENVGKGETSNLEQGEVSEPVEIEDRNDRNKLESWTSGQKLKIIPVDTPIYEDLYDADYWTPMLQEGSTNKQIKLYKGDIVTYQGEYEIYNNALTGDQTIYVKITTEDGIEGYLKLSTVEAVGDNETSSSMDTNENIKLATTSRAEVSRDAQETTIGVEGDTYVVAIAAGRNSNNDTGIVSEDGTLVEEELTIQVAERVEELLSGYSNIKVVQTGSTSDNPDGVEPEDRTQLARDANPDLCIQIYFGDGDESGVETIYKEGDFISQQLAEILAENLASSMGLTNLQAGEDSAKCVDSEGNAASLNIIESAGTTGFPSVVAMGGNLNIEPDAGIIAGDGVDKYAQAIVDSIDEYFKADHSGLTATDTGEVTYTTSVESRIINMHYVPEETLQGYIDSGDFENAIKSYTLDENRNVVVATWSVGQGGGVELKTNNSMSLKTALEKYTMPYEYLLYFYIDTDYEDFVEDLADEVMNSEIVVAVQDNVTTTSTTITTEQRTVADNKDFSDYSTDWSAVTSSGSTTETVSTRVNLTYVSTWCVKAYQENSYSEAVLELGNEEEKIVEVPGKVTETGPSSSYSGEEEFDSGTAPSREVDDNGFPIRYSYTVYRREKTVTHTISNTYEAGEYKTEGRENVFVKLYNDHDMIAKVRTSDYLFSIIENNERTANLLNLTKYLIFKATNVPYGVLKFDYEGIYNLEQFVDTGTSMGGLSTFKEYLHSWEGHTGISEDGTKYIVGDDGAGHPTVGYGIDIYNSGFLDRFLAAGYDVSIGSYIDVEFVDALEDEEIQNALKTVEEKTAGLNLTQYQKYALVSRIYNCGSSGAFRERNGKTFVEAYNSYWNQEIDDEYGVTANESMYNHPLYQSYMYLPNTSGGNYMAGLENRRKSEWILFKTGYYDRIDKWCSNTTGGSVVEAAVQCHAYLRNNGFTYAQTGNNIPITGTGGHIDCSSYVSWVLYEAGFTEFEGYQKTSSVFTSNPWGWEEVSVSEAQPGDILTYSGHVEIVAGDAGDKFRVYNCGSDNSINAEGTEDLPESSVSGYSKSSVIKVLRPPQN